MKDLCLLKEANVMFMKFIKYLNIVLIAIVLILFIFLVIPKLNAEELPDYPTPQLDTLNPVSQLNGNEISEDQQTAENPNLEDESKKNIWDDLDKEEMGYEDMPSDSADWSQSEDYLIDLGNLGNSYADELTIFLDGKDITNDVVKDIDYTKPLLFKLSYVSKSELPTVVYFTSIDKKDRAIFYPTLIGTSKSGNKTEYDYELSFYKGVKTNYRYKLVFYVFPGNSAETQMSFSNSPVKAFPANTENLLEKIMSINKDLEIADSMTVDNIAQIADIPSSNLQTVKEALDNADIDAEDIVGSISLITDENGNPYYVVTKMQEKKFLGIIPIGNEQVVEKINAIRSEEQ